MADPALPAWLTAPDVVRAIRTLPGLDGASVVQWSGGPLAGVAANASASGVWKGSR